MYRSLDSYIRCRLLSMVPVNEVVPLIISGNSDIHIYIATFGNDYYRHLLIDHQYELISAMNTITNYGNSEHCKRLLKHWYSGEFAAQRMNNTKREFWVCERWALPRKITKPLAAKLRPLLNLIAKYSLYRE